MKWREAPTALVLAFALACVNCARASADEEGAWAAAPTSCVVEQFALRSYVTSLRSGDVTLPARELAQLAQGITPLCSQAIENGRWPGLATELLSHASGDPSMKKVICQIAPPEALSAIVEWEEDDEGTRSGYDVDCALALFRYRPADFKRRVWPRLTSRTGRQLAPLAHALSAALHPDERLALLPLLDFTTENRVQGRDDLYGVLCQSALASAQPACHAPAALEEQWAHEGRVQRAATRVGLLAGLALLFVLTATVLWKTRRRSTAAAPVERRTRAP